MSEPSSSIHSVLPAADSGANPIAAWAADSPPLPVIPIATAARFCTRCGTLLDPHDGTCHTCAAREMRQTQLRSAGEAPPPSIVSAISLYFALLGATVIGIIAIANQASISATLILLSIAHSAIVLGWALKNWRSIISAIFTRVRPKWLLISVGGGVATFAVAHASIELLVRYAHIQRLTLSDGFLRDGYGWITVVLIACLQPAVIEEIGFRGVIFSTFQPLLRPAETILLTAVMFMVLHLTVASFPHLLLMGVVLGWLRWRTGSLLPGMMLHFTHNLLCVLAEAH